MAKLFGTGSSVVEEAELVAGAKLSDSAHNGIRLFLIASGVLG